MDIQTKKKRLREEKGQQLWVPPCVSDEDDPDMKVFTYSFTFRASNVDHAFQFFQTEVTVLTLEITRRTRDLFWDDGAHDFLFDGTTPPDAEVTFTTRLAFSCDVDPDLALLSMRQRMKRLVKKHKDNEEFEKMLETLNHAKDYTGERYFLDFKREREEERKGDSKRIRLVPTEEILANQ